MSAGEGEHLGRGSTWDGGALGTGEHLGRGSTWDGGALGKGGQGKEAIDMVD